MEANTVKRLRCVSTYRHEARGRELYFAPGQVIEPDPGLCAFLLADAPGCFEVVPDPEPAEVTDADADFAADATEPGAKSLARPPRDKAFRAPGSRKGEA